MPADYGVVASVMLFFSVVLTEIDIFVKTGLLIFHMSQKSSSINILLYMYNNYKKENQKM